MLDYYCDFKNEKIINYVGMISEEYFGLDLIKKVYTYVKNSIYYDPFSKEQKASETLVLGRGDNFSKNILLYTMLKALNFHCYLEEERVKDNTRKLISRKDEVVKWYFVKLVFFNRDIAMDPSFDKSYIRAARIENKCKYDEFYIEGYYVDHLKLFNKIENVNFNKEKNSKEEDILKTKIVHHG